MPIKIRKLTKEFCESLFYVIDGVLYRKEWVDPCGRKQGGKRLDRNKTDKNGYIMVCAGNSQFYYHRILWTLINGEIPEGMWIDHINGTDAGNHISNLRLVEGCRENAKNRKEHRDGKLVGARYDKRRKHWKSFIFMEGGQLHLGCVDTEEEAHSRHSEAAKLISEGYNGEYIQKHFGVHKPTSRHKGVYWDREYQKWGAQFRGDSYRVKLGRFDTEQEAKNAIEVAEKFRNKYIDNKQFRELVIKELKQ